MSGVRGSTTSGLIGREQELEVLRSAFARVAESSPATVLVEGDAGVGKTRLVETFRQQLGSDVLTLVGGCVERGASGVPFAPFTAALRQLEPARIAAAVPSALRTALGHLLPTLGPPDHSLEREGGRAVLFEQVLQLLAALAGRQPTVLVIEDVHWSAASSRDLLDFLVRNQQAVPGLLIVATARDGHVVATSDDATTGPNDPLAAWLAELDRIGWVTRCRLGGLSRPEVAELIAELCGHEPEPATTDRVLRRSGGNPLFVEAIAAEETSQAGVPAATEAGVPASLRDLLLGPFRRLPRPAAHVVDVVAVGGGTVAHRLVQAVCHLDDQELHAALRAAVDARVLVAHADGYAMRHELVREAVYDALLAGERPQLHRAYATAIAADGGTDGGAEGGADAALAHHWGAAGEPDRSVVAAWRAAAAARAVFAYDEELGLLTHVLDHWDRVDDPAGIVGAARVEVLIGAAEAARHAGRPARGVELATRALEGLTEGHEADELAMSVLGTRSAMRAELGDPDALDDLDAAEGRAGSCRNSDAGCHARLLVSRGEHLRTLPRQDEALEAAERGLALAGAAGDERTRVAALILTASLRGRTDGFDEQLGAFHEAQDSAARHGFTDLELQAVETEADEADAFGRYEHAVQVARRGAQLAAQVGRARTNGTRFAAVLASALRSLGRWDDALEVVDEALERSPVPVTRAELLVLRAAIAFERGDDDLPRLALERVREVADASARLWLPAAQLELDLLVAAARSRGTRADAAAVEHALERVLARPAAGDASRFAWPYLAAGARAVSHLDDDAADRVRGGLETWAAEIPAFGVVQQAHRSTYQAAIAGHAWGAEQGWGAAQRAWEAMGDPFQAARAGVAWAEAHLAAGGDREEAAEQLRSAVDAATELGAVRVRDDASALVRRARLPVVVDEDGDADPVESLRRRLGLTDRELEVLRWLADGRSNQDIAAELFISPKTVSVHVSRILAKLGLTNRTEAAALAHRLGLGD